MPVFMVVPSGVAEVSVAVGPVVSDTLFVTDSAVNCVSAFPATSVMEVFRYDTVNVVPGIISLTTVMVMVLPDTAGIARYGVHQRL